MAAQNGVVTFERPNGTKFTYSVYFDDTATNPVRWLKDGKAAAASPDNLIITEVSAVVDVVLAAASGQTTTVVKKNDLPVSTLLNALHLASITTRPVPGILCLPGQKLTMIQVA